jgi:hypothetical protein
MERARNHQSKGAAWALPLFATLMLIGYVLSIGPAARLAWFDMISVDSYRVAYAPLLAAAEKSAPTKRVLTWYVELWVPPFLFSLDNP